MNGDIWTLDIRESGEADPFYAQRYRGGRRSAERKIRRFLDDFPYHSILERTQTTNETYIRLIADYRIGRDDRIMEIYATNI